MPNAAGFTGPGLVVCFKSNSLIGVVRKSLFALNILTAIGSDASLHWVRSSEGNSGTSTVDFDLGRLITFCGLLSGDFDRVLSLDSGEGTSGDGLIVVDFLRFRKKSTIPLDPDRGRGAGSELDPNSGSAILKGKEVVGRTGGRW